MPAARNPTPAARRPGRHAMPHAYPPGPKDVTFGLRLGAQFKRDPLGWLSRVHEQYGDVVYVRLGPYRSYWLFHPDPVKEVLVTKAKSFRRTGRQVDVLRQWNGDSLITSEGEAWLRQRRMVQPAFSARRFGT